MSNLKSAISVMLYAKGISDANHIAVIDDVVQFDDENGDKWVMPLVKITMNKEGVTNEYAE